MHSCTPVAPKVCPVRDFVDVTMGRLSSNTDFIAFYSIGSPAGEEVP